MHYSWSTEARARRALANVSALLRPGGIFIGTMPDANVIIKKLREGLSCAHDFPLGLDSTISYCFFKKYKMQEECAFGGIWMLDSNYTPHEH